MKSILKSMKLKSWRRCVFVILICPIVLIFNACSSGFEVNSFFENHASEIEALVLNGSGIAGYNYPGCSPGANDDFFEKMQRARLMPRDCKAVEINPPLFSWINPSDRNKSTKWTLKIVTADGKPFSTTQLDNPVGPIFSSAFPAGEYSWSVSYESVDGSLHESNFRKFLIRSGTTEPQIATSENIQSLTASRLRPRLLTEGATFSKILTKAKSEEYIYIFQDIEARAQSGLSRPIPPPAPNWTSKDFPNDADYKLWIKEIKGVLMKEEDLIETMSLYYNLTGKVEFRDGVIERIMALTLWDPKGATSQAQQDLENRMIFMSLANGYDLMGSELSDEQRATIMNIFKIRITDALPDSFSLYDVQFDSHAVGNLGYLLQALLLTSGDTLFPEASDNLKEIWALYIHMANMWGDDDGSFGNSMTYAWTAAIRLPNINASVFAITKQNLFVLPYMKRLGRFLINFTAPITELPNPFGDGLEKTKFYAMYSSDLFRLMAYMTGDGIYEWYWRQDPDHITKPVSSDISHLLLLGFDVSRPSPLPPTENSSLFSDTGLVAIHDDVASPLRSSVFFRSSRFGSINHSHADQNSFTYNSKGQALLISSGYYPYYLSPHHSFVTRATRYKNALTFDGGIGQAELSADPTEPNAPAPLLNARGDIINFADTPDYSMTTGDASLAYRNYNSLLQVWTPYLDKVYRTIFYLKKYKSFLVYDYAQSKTARKWELNFHSYNPFQDFQGEYKVVKENSFACLALYNFPSSFSQTSAWDIDPEYEMPSQNHVRFSKSTPSQEFAALTIVREDCQSNDLTYSAAGSKINVLRSGKEIVSFDQKSVTVH